MYKKKLINTQITVLTKSNLHASRIRDRFNVLIQNTVVTPNVNFYLTSMIQKIYKTKNTSQL